MSAWRRLVSEAHRRSLWQVLGIYLMGSWVGFQVVLDLVEGIGLPSWLPGLAATLFVIGLPIVLATAFVQQGVPGLTPQPSDDTLDPTLFPASRSSHSDAHDDAAAAPVPAPRSRMAGILTWRRAITAGMTAFTVLGVVTAGWLALRAVGVGPMASLLAAAELEENDRILIAEFDARGADSTLAAVVTDAFRIDFARSTVMRSVAPAEVQDVLARMGVTEDVRIDAELARQIAVRDGISAYVTGEVSAVGSSYLVSARLIGTSSGEVLVVLREKADEADDLIDAVDRMSTKLRERTGESLRTIRRAEPLAKVTTPSLEALTAYTQALRASSQDGDPDRSLELHEQAIRLDTAFAAAHRAIGIHWYNRGESELSIESLERALSFTDRLSELERASALSALHLTRSEYADAAAALERVIALDPENFAALNNLGLTYASMKDHDRAEEYYRRSVQADTGRFFAYTNLGEHLVIRGRYDEAEEALRNAAIRAPQSPWPVVALAAVPYHAGNPTEAERRLRGLLNDPASPLGVQMRAGEHLYLLLRTQGRIAESKALLRAHVEAAGGNAEAEVYALFDAIWDDLFLFDRGQDVRRHVPALKAAAAQPGAENVQVDAAIGCAWAGDADCARALLANTRGRGELRPWSNIEVRSAHAGIARADGDRRRALQVLAETRTSCIACELPYMGYLYEELEQPDSAAAAYERYIASPSMDRIWGDAALPIMHEMLAGYYEQRGDANTAAQHYARVIALWEHADPPLQPRVEAARLRLAQLQPDR